METTPVLCGYCPRRIVAREGQHVAKGAKALGKVVPLRTRCSSISGILGSRVRSASSVRISRMFGRSPASPASAALLPPVSFPRHPAAHNQAKHHHRRQFVCARGRGREGAEKALTGHTKQGKVRPYV